MMGNKSSTAIQTLYELCKKTFTPNFKLGSPVAVEKVRSLLDTITPSEVGLREDHSDDERGLGYGSNLFRNKYSARAARWTPPITYLHIYEGKSFTGPIYILHILFGICLPALPLPEPHGLVTSLAKDLSFYDLRLLRALVFCRNILHKIRMTVLSKILYGSMHVKAYDWVEPACIRKTADTQIRLAKLKVDTVLTAPCETAVLFPRTGGNIHCFTAVASCAVLDVLAPPYSEAEGRNCTYYHDHPYSSFGDGLEIDESEENYAWLEEIAAPDDFYVLPGKYLGPVVRA